jgi:EAL and modified HD-GYP domain-containing signal transduction protein
MLMRLPPGQESHLAMPRIITRQPVLDRYEAVYGFEVLPGPGEEILFLPAFDHGSGEEHPEGEGSIEELDEITGGMRAFIKCRPETLLSGQGRALPRDRVVLEIESTGEPAENVVESCRTLKDAGFVIALDGFYGEREEPLADLADIIAMDVTASTDRAQWLLIRKYRPKGTTFLAKNVDKRAQFQAAVQQGFSYFYGPFYTRPQPYAAAEVTPTKLVYLLVLGAVTRPDVNVQEVADTIKHDLALSYRLLRFLNSARFAFHSQIKSIRHALLLLGQNETRKWVGLISVHALGEGAPPVLVTMALIRGAFCEYLAPLVGAPKRQPDYFFLGLLSCIDVLMRRPMRVMLAELPIAADVGAALMGEQNSLRDVLEVVVNYEQGNWEEVSRLAKKLDLKEQTFSNLYVQALRWSRELTDAQQQEEPVPEICS